MVSFITTSYYRSGAKIVQIGRTAKRAAGRGSGVRAVRLPLRSAALFPCALRRRFPALPKFCHALAKVCHGLAKALSRLDKKLSRLDKNSIRPPDSFARRADLSGRLPDFSGRRAALACRAQKKAAGTPRGGWMPVACVAGAACMGGRSALWCRAGCPVRYQTSTRCFLGTKSGSRLVMLNALYQASMCGSAPFTRQRPGLWGSVLLYWRSSSSRMLLPQMSP